MTADALDVRTILAVAVIIAVVQVVGGLIGRLGQPRVIGEIVAGVLLGPSVLGIVAPDLLDLVFPSAVIEALHVIAQLGLVLFMFLVGLELDFGVLRGQGRRVAVTAQASILVPVLLAVPLAVGLYPGFGNGVDPVAFCLFIATAMGITAFPVLARLLRETGLQGSRIGSLSLVCAAVNDLAAWCLLAVVVSVVQATGPAAALRTLGLLLLLVAVMTLVVRPVLARLPDLPLWLVLLVVLVCAWTSDALGGHVVIGAFLAGAVMPRRERWQQSVHTRLDGVVSVLLLPVFFAVVGLSTRIDQLGTLQVWAVVALVIAVATVGKFGGSSLAARLVGERWTDSITIGVLMNTRGLTEVVVLTVGLQLGVISTTMFTIMVLMALTTTVMAAPALRLIRSRDRRQPSCSGPEHPGRESADSRRSARTGSR
jgi:Kef-type K+ transport system membrane component KefB